MTKFATNRPFADPEAAARKLIEIAAGIPAVQDGRIYIERINALFVALLNGSKGHPEFGAGIKHAIDQGWLDLHESGTYIRILAAGDTLLPT